VNKIKDLDCRYLKTICRPWLCRRRRSLRF